jgi:phosphoribosylaminoimidazole-succinocarboxamide synthase
MRGMTMAQTVLETSLEGLKLLKRGKVRDIYEVGENLLIVATDRISAFDWVLPSAIPDKGAVLTRLSAWWFDHMSPITGNHLVTTDTAKMPGSVQVHASLLEGRSMLVRRADVLPVECVVRGYLAGSGWKDYKKHQAVCGIPLPEGLKLSSRLPEPIFTPATKAEEGHDENIDFARMRKIVGKNRAETLRKRSFQVYKEAHRLAEHRGIIIADTKFEWGVIGDEIVLVDEILTPDSSRFWNRETYREGKAQDQFDKQIVRDWLEQQPWDKNSPPPELPQEIIAKTSARYIEVYERITGKKF